MNPIEKAIKEIEEEINLEYSRIETAVVEARIGALEMALSILLRSLKGTAMVDVMHYGSCSQCDEKYSECMLVGQNKCHGLGNPGCPAYVTEG